MDGEITKCANYWFSETIAKKELRKKCHFFFGNDQLWGENITYLITKNIKIRK